MCGLRETIWFEILHSEPTIVGVREVVFTHHRPGINKPLWAVNFLIWPSLNRINRSDYFQPVVKEIYFFWFLIILLLVHS